MRDDANAVLVGVLVVVAVVLVVVLGAVMMDVADGGAPPWEREATPGLVVMAEGTDLVVIRATDGLWWDHLVVEGCSVVPTGHVRPGDRIESCGGAASIRVADTGRVIWRR